MTNTIILIPIVFIFIITILSITDLATKDNLEWAKKNDPQLKPIIESLQTLIRFPFDLMLATIGTIVTLLGGKQS